jgi:hypothetical protein
MRPCNDITCVRLVGDLDMDNKALREDNAKLRDALRLIGIAAECERGALQKPGILKLVRKALDKNTSTGAEDK